MTVVMKFGGTSVGSPDSIKNVLDIVKLRLSRKPIVVVSAVGGVTDLLIDSSKEAVELDDVSHLIEKIKEKHYAIMDALKIDREIIKEDLFELNEVYESMTDQNIEVMDIVQSFGERMSSKLVAAFLTNSGVPAKVFNAYDIGMITNSDYGNAEPLFDSPLKIKESLAGVSEVPIITGFIAKDEKGNITTLGRGGSDYTAAIIGAAVNSEEIEIWTDVSGIMSADPKVVEKPECIKELSFAEASELAFFGAKVLHPKTILPAMNKEIPVRVLNTYEPTDEGTVIVKEIKVCVKEIKAIACKKKIIEINISSLRMLFAHGFLARVFDIFENYGVSVDMVSTSEVSISLTVNNENHLTEIIAELSKIAKVKVIKDRSIVCVVGACMREVPGVVGRIFSALGKNNINTEMISQGASEINLSFTVKAEDSDNAVKSIHDEFFN